MADLLPAGPDRVRRKVLGLARLESTRRGGARWRGFDDEGS